MYAKRIIPCLDVKDGRVVKGMSFVNLRDAGDPVEAAAAYDRQGADELVLLDILASHQARGTMIGLSPRGAPAKCLFPLRLAAVFARGDFTVCSAPGRDKVS